MSTESTAPETEAACYNLAMPIEIVLAGPEDFPDVLVPVNTAFGETRSTDEQLADHRLSYEEYRALGAREQGQWVGMVADFAFDLTLPGHRALPVSGVTMVGVLPTHRRRGVASALMGRLLDDAAGRGLAVAVLMAMEAPIYRRFGFGAASRFATVSVDTTDAGFLEAPSDAGTLTLVDHIEGTRRAEGVWERHRHWRPGTTGRLAWMWELARRDRDEDRGGASAMFWVVYCDDHGEPDGFASYRLCEKDDRGLPRWVAIVTDLVATSPEVEAVLFRYLCDIDLVDRVEIAQRPVDDHLRWRLIDQRRYQVTNVSDHLWARVLDVPAALSARRYASTDELVIEVDDHFRPAAGGRFVVSGGPTEARCERTDAAPDLSMGAPELASLFLGTVAPSILAGAGLVEASDEVLARADSFFASEPAPFACTEF